MLDEWSQFRPAVLLDYVSFIVSAKDRLRNNSSYTSILYHLYLFPFPVLMFRILQRCTSMCGPNIHIWVRVVWMIEYLPGLKSLLILTIFFTFWRVTFTQQGFNSQGISSKSQAQSPLRQLESWRYLRS